MVCFIGGSVGSVSADPGTAAVRGNAAEDLSDCSTGLMLVIGMENLYIFLNTFSSNTMSVINADYFYKPNGIIGHFVALNRCTVSYYFLTFFFF